MKLELPEWDPEALRQNAEALYPLREELKATVGTHDHAAASYTPHFHAVHSHSTGYAQRIPGAISTRLHDLLSRGEACVFIMHDWQRRRYRNIRERLALPLAYTTLVAKCLKGVAHPRRCLYTDFLLTLAGGGWEAVDYSPKTKVTTKRNRARYGIIARALELVGITHSILTEDDLDAVVIRNYRWLRIHTLNFDEAPLPEGIIRIVAPLLRAELVDGQTDIFTAATRVSAATGHAKAQLARVCYHLIAREEWDVELTNPIGPDYPVSFCTELISESVL